ncbi:hypothetical protein ACFQZC_35510 [Streptacidiphilus monticola]
MPFSRSSVLAAASGAAAAALVVAPACTGAAQAANAVSHSTGTLADGATWIADTPADWNGTLLLFSHGFGPTSAADAPPPPRRARSSPRATPSPAPPTTRTGPCGRSLPPSGTSSRPWTPSAARSAGPAA